jgi:hypothetical protein
MLILEYSQECYGVKIWPCDLWPWRSIGFQIFLRIKYVPSLVKIHWRMLILECSQGCYGRTDERTVALLYPFATWRGDNKINQTWLTNIAIGNRQTEHPLTSKSLWTLQRGTKNLKPYNLTKWTTGSPIKNVNLCAQLDCSCSTSGTRRVTLLENPVTSHARWKAGIVTLTNGTWLSIAQIFCKG